MVLMATTSDTSRLKQKKWIEVDRKNAESAAAEPTFTVIDGQPLASHNDEYTIVLN